MKIFYLNLSSYDLPQMSRTERKKLQSQLGRYIVDYVANFYYDIRQREVFTENGKPKFLHSDLCFNISHSNDIVLAAFDSMPLGVDVEFMRDRNFKDLFAHYGINADGKELFYRFWTNMEAKIKIQAEVKQELCLKLNDSYMVSVLSANPDEGIKTRLKIYELSSPAARINPNELINLKLVNASSANENTLVAQERIIAPEEFFPPLALKTE